MQRSDQLLVEAACNGDIESFRELYERHYSRIVAIARSHLHDQHLAEDAAQETFAVACQKLSTLTNADRLPQWLRVICRRISHRMLRSSRRAAPLDHDPPQNNESADLSEHEDNKARLQQAVTRLSASQREIIYLRYYSDQSYQQIADLLGLTAKAVHGRLQRARRELTRQMKKSGQHNPGESTSMNIEPGAS